MFVKQLSNVMMVIDLRKAVLPGERKGLKDQLFQRKFHFHKMPHTANLCNKSDFIAFFSRQMNTEIRSIYPTRAQITKTILHIGFSKHSELAIFHAS